MPSTFRRTQGTGFKLNPNIEINTNKIYRHEKDKLEQIRNKTDPPTCKEKRLTRWLQFRLNNYKMEADRAKQNFTTKLENRKDKKKTTTNISKHIQIRAVVPGYRRGVRVVPDYCSPKHRRG